MDANQNFKRFSGEAYGSFTYRPVCRLQSLEPLICVSGALVSDGGVLWIWLMGYDFLYSRIVSSF